MSRCAPILAVLLLVPGMGFAQTRPIDENVTYGYAQVLRASPVYETFRTRTPEQRCDGQPAATAATGQRPQARRGLLFRWRRRIHL